MNEVRTESSEFWGRLFTRRPELDPPGYRETILKMGYKVKEFPEEVPEECDIEF